MEFSLSHEAVGQLLKGKEEVEEKAEKATADLERKCIFCRILPYNIRSMLSVLLLLCCIVLLPGACTIQGLRGPSQDP